MEASLPEVVVDDADEAGGGPSEFGRFVGCGVREDPWHGHADVPVDLRLS